MVNIQDLFDAAKCYNTIRDVRWPEGVTYPRCSLDLNIKNGKDDIQPLRLRFDGLTGTVFAEHSSRLADWGYGHETRAMGRVRPKR